MRWILKPMVAVTVASTSSVAFSQLPTRELSLAEAVSAAMKHDPQLQAARASRDVGLEREKIALGGLLPTISATVTNNPNSTTQTRIPNSTIPSQRDWFENRYDYDSRMISIRQPIIRLRNWATYLQGRTQSEQAEARFRFDKYEAYTRIVEIYANWLSTEQRIQSERAKNSFWQGRFLQVRGLRLKGQAVLSDELQAEAEYRRSLYELNEAEREMAFLIDRFSQLVGGSARPKSLAFSLNENTLKALPGLEELKRTVLKNNPELKAIALTAEAAKWDIKKFQSDHLPSLDLVANYSEDNNATAVLLGRQTRSTLAGIQLTIPIYQGGSVSASVRQALAEYNRLLAELNVAENRVLGDVTRVYSGLRSAISLYKFSEEQTAFAEENLRSTQEQQRLGFKTPVDVSKARELLSTSRSDRARAQAMWIVSKVELLALNGDLDQFEGSELIALGINR